MQHVESRPQPPIYDRPSHPNVFTRLQALFPTTPLSPNQSPVVEGSDASHQPPTPPLKVRIITWNMHESLPKGDLQELLGVVPPYTPSASGNTPGVLPYLTEGSGHPYHLVVVAGQECPSLSGIPLGLGAGFKLKEKEKEKEKEKDADKARDNDPERELERNRQKFKEGLKELHRNRLLKQEQEESSHHPPSGWTSILEDFFCSGVQGVGHARKDFVRSDSRARDLRAPELDRAFSTGDIHRRRAVSKVSDVRKGPYEMLVKERMMGIYLAIFVHRDARHLVEGTSKSAVTAGLIGGRVGNKGGVGISLKINGATMLFVNAHLAAHEGKLLNRMANLIKIKSELSVDPFLKPDDHRMMAEDLTDKFDYTFLCGDLNFRLDISRLHADWLISRQEYAQALAFDQLYNIMRNGQAFVGFREGPINFPPTFKYDVLRTLKSKPKRGRPPGVQEVVSELSGDESAPRRSESRLSRDSSEDEDEEPDREALSVVSSGTGYSKKTTDAEDDDGDNESSSEDDSDSDEEDVRQKPMPQRNHAKELVKRLSVTAALKAKVKWQELVSPGSPRPSSKWPRASERPVRRDIEGQSSSMPVTPSLSKQSTTSFSGVSTSRSVGDHDSLVHSPPMKQRPSSIKSVVHSVHDGVDGERDDDKGVYDSSSKQRVPSWCDRILFKSTVKPDPEGDEDDRSTIPRSNFFANAWRSFSSRGRKESMGSMHSTDQPSHFPPTDAPSPPDTRPPSPLPSNTPARRRRRPVSIEISPDLQFPPPLLSKSHSSMALNRQYQSPTHSPPLPSSPPRPKTAVPVRARTAPDSQPTVSPSFPSSSGSSSPELPPPTPPRDVAHNANVPRWRLLSFLARDPHESRASTPVSEILPTPTRPRRGEVVCLSYGTLDDRGMRRLEGRSDHRPVIGCYAVYI